MSPTLVRALKLLIQLSIFSILFPYNSINRKNNIASMKESTREYKLTNDQLQIIMNNLLKIPKRNKLIHPCQERTHYSSVLQWLMASVSNLLKNKQVTQKQLAQQQQELILSTLSEMIELTRKECQQKSIILQMVMQYLVSTLNAYFALFQNFSKEINYQFEHNTVKMEKGYMAEVKGLQIQNEELKKEKEHRWRNMYMLIKDNRIYRKQNKKLMKSVDYQMEKNMNLAQQMILLRNQNQKMKVKLNCLEEEGVKIEGYIETKLKLLQLEKKIQQYPKRSKKILKNQLLKIQISQINNLNDKITFIIRAIEETGQIIDEYYDQDIVWTNFQYNISTQTQTISLEEKAINTLPTKSSSVQCETTCREHIQLDYVDVLSMKVKGTKPERRQISRQSKNVMFLSQTFGNSKLSFSSLLKKDQKSRHLSKRIEPSDHFSLCESIKITIFNGRISYISTYNTEICNGNQLVKKIENESKSSNRGFSHKKIAETADAQIQTDQGQIRQYYQPCLSRTQNKNTTKIIMTNSYDFQKQLKTGSHKGEYLNISQQIYLCFDPSKNRIQHSRFKMSNGLDKQPFSPYSTNSGAIGKSIVSQKIMDSVKQSHKTSKVLQDYDKLPQKMLLYKQNQNDIKFSIKRLLKKQDKPQSQSSIDSYEQSQKKIKTIKTVTQGNNIGKQSLYEHTKNNKHQNQQNSSIITPSELKPNRSSMQKLPFNTIDTLSLNKNVSLSKLPRNLSSIVSATNVKGLQSLQSKRISKIVESKQAQKHKRTVTDGNQIQSNAKVEQLNKGRQFKIKPLHRISEDLGQTELNLQQKTVQIKPKQKSVKIFPFLLTKEGELVIKEMDLSKGIEKILKNMDMRRNQLLNNNYTLKSYLASYFKCLYGKQLLPNFMRSLLSASETQEITLVFNRLLNSNLPEAYLIDLFKTFVLMLNKCYLVGESPVSGRIRADILRYMVGVYFQDEEVNQFTSRMKLLGCYNFMGWFNALQGQLRNYSINSQLFDFLSAALPESEELVCASLIEQLTYFIHTDTNHHQHIINTKMFITNKMAFHRLCLFCHRYNWTRLLNIQTSIEHEYCRRVGTYNQEQSLARIMPNLQIIAQFKYLGKYLKYWLQCKNKYGQIINRHLVMLIQLNVQEYRVKNQMPLSRQLKFISLAFEGLQKKLYYQQIQAEGETRKEQNGRNHSVI